jgi:Holliday junction resolvase
MSVLSTSFKALSDIVEASKEANDGTRMTIHINLLSAQILPNAIPTLAMLSTVDTIYLVVAGEEFLGKAKHLKQFYHRKGIENVELFQCPDANDYYSLRYKAKELFDDISAFHPGKQVILNATCGTKPMSFAFVRQFDNADENSLAIYVASDNNQIVFLSDSDKLKNVSTESVMNIDDYLYLNMFQLSSKTDRYYDEEVEARAAISKSYLKLAGEYPKLVSLVNHLTQETNFNQSERFNKTVPLVTKPHGSVEAFFDILKYESMIKYSNHSITFNSIEVARYLGGGWFEELIYLAAKEAQIEEVALNVTGQLINSDGEVLDVQNELDVVLLQNNHMMIIEAKTANWENAVNVGQEAMSKLDSLSRNYGGSHTRATVATFHPLPKEVQQRVDSVRHMASIQVESFEQLVEFFDAWKQQSIATL